MKPKIDYEELVILIRNAKMFYQSKEHDYFRQEVLQSTRIVEELKRQGIDYYINATSFEKLVDSILDLTNNLISENDIMAIISELGFMIR